MEANNVLSLSLGEYISKVNDLKQKLGELTQTSSEYKQIAEQLKNVNESISESLSGFSKKVDPTIDSMANLVSSIQGMKNELQHLEIGSDRFVELSGKIRESQERLADLKNQMGDNAESVKSLSGAMTSALSAAFRLMRENTLRMPKMQPKS